METKFNFKSQMCTTVAQSERLLSLGLKKDTADMGSVRNLVHTTSKGTREVIFTFTPDNWEANPDSIPRWSLHRLIEMIPKCVRAHSSGDDSPRLHPYVPKFDYQGVTIENIDEILADFYEHTDLFDNIINFIEWLIKNGYFNKEYLV